MASASNFRRRQKRHNCAQRFREQKHRRNNQSMPQRFLVQRRATSCKDIKVQSRLCQVKTMFKQHVNRMI